MICNINFDYSHTIDDNLITMLTSIMYTKYFIHSIEKKEVQ